MTSTLNTPEIAPQPELESPQLPTLRRGIGWSFGFIALYFLCIFVYIIGYSLNLGIENAETVLADPDWVEAQIDSHIDSNAFLINFSIIELLVLTPFLLLVSNFKTQSWKQTLGFNRLSMADLKTYGLAFIAYTAASIFVHEFLLGTETPEFISTMAGTKSIGLVFTLLIVAPIVEELFCRGYLFKTLRHTRLGAIGTIGITSLVFTMAHYGQYETTILFDLFLFSILLGMAREKSGSILLPMLLHFVNNLISVVLVVFLGIV
jgi:membrane protease YdiL (CAAX protease family)